MDEQELIRRSQAGEKAAVEELLGRYEGLVYNLTLRYFGDRPEAADAGQEAMIRIYRSLGRFKGESSFKTWVYRVATNVCLDLLRRQKNTPSSLDELGGDERPFHPLLPGDADPAESTERGELRTILLHALGSLAEPYRFIVVLRDLEGLTYEEIASILGCPPGTVKSRLARARAALRRKLLSNPRATGWVERRLQA